MQGDIGICIDSVGARRRKRSVHARSTRTPVRPGVAAARAFRPTDCRDKPVRNVHKTLMPAGASPLRRASAGLATRGSPGRLVCRFEETRVDPSVHRYPDEETRTQDTGSDGFGGIVLRTRAGFRGALSCPGRRCRTYRHGQHRARMERHGHPPQERPVGRDRRPFGDGFRGGNGQHPDVDQFRGRHADMGTPGRPRRQPRFGSCLRERSDDKE